MVVRGQRRLHALRLAFITLIIISAMLTAVAIAQPTAANAFGSFGIALGAVGVLLAAYFGGDAWAKAKGKALPDES